MSKEILSLDIHTKKKQVIDIASMMPLSDLHAMNHTSDNVFDDFLIGQTDIDIFFVPTIQIDRYVDIRSADIVLPNRITRHSGNRKRKRYLNLVKPLYIPYGSLDVRGEEQIQSEKKYADIFTRPLSRSLMMRRHAKTAKRFLKRNKKGIIGTILMTFIITVPILWYVKMSIESGYAKLLSLPKVQNITEAQKVTHEARLEFERANFLFLPYSWIPLDIVDLAHRASLGGLSLSRSMDTLLGLIPTGSGSIVRENQGDSSITPSFRADARDFFLLSRFGIETPTNWMKEHDEALSVSVAGFQEAGKLYAGVSGYGELANKIRNTGNALVKVSGYLSWYLAHKENILAMLGDDNPVRYVVLNQNRDEIRANGGFPGTVISFSLYKGNILDYRQDDVYYYDWNLYPYKEQPPPGLALLSGNYGLRDVNYYPDFRETVEKANSFIERSGDSTITTGISIHQGIIEEVLKDIGPVSVSGVSIPFDSKNFSALMSTLVEAQYGRELHAKDILFDFIHAFVAKINDTKKYDVVFRVLEKYWNDGEILIASRDETTENFLGEFKKKLPWECQDAGGAEISGESNIVSAENDSITGTSVQGCSQNWAYPIFTSVGGNKTDRYIKRSYAATVKRVQGCTFENTLTITNRHTFSAYDKQDIKSYIQAFHITDADTLKKIDFVEGNSPNKSFVRVYLPPSATPMGNGGSIEVSTGSENTVFSFFLDTPVGGAASKSLHYTTEIPHCVNYSGGIDWYRQPGLRDVEMK